MKRLLIMLALLVSQGVFAKMEFLPGSSPQTTVAGAAFPNPIRIRVTDDATGLPIAGYRLSYFVRRFVMSASGICDTDPLGVCVTYTDSNGIATIVARAGLQFHVTLGFDGGLFAELTAVKAPGRDSYPVASMWWEGPQQTGWGVSVPQHGAAVFPVVFAYDDSGAPTWYVLEGDWTLGFGSNYEGHLVTFAGAPYFAFDTSRVKAQVLPGNVGLFMNGSPYGTLYVPRFESAIGSRILDSSTYPMQPLDFAPDVIQPERGLSDIWWGGPAQAGWGISIAEDKGNLFATWFTYDAGGKATWFAMTEGAWIGPDTWAGPVYRTTGRSIFQWPPYDASRFSATRVGDFKLRFSGTSAATFEYSVEGHAGTLELQRFDY